MFSTFQEANEYLENLIPLGFSYNPKDVMKLDRVKYLLKLLGNPHKKIKTIHIGGTSGKGSTAYFLSQILVGQGYKIGLHTSPHLKDISERMQINGRPIPDKNFIYHVNRIEPLIGKVEKDLRLGKPTYFETTVAITFDYFAKQNVDIAIIEVGLGGKLDATNIIHPLVSIITNVDLDHTEILGNTVEKIAKDKSGIIKKEVPVISGTNKLAVKNIIAKKAQENDSKYFLRGETFDYSIKKIDFSGINFNFSWLGESKEYQLSTPAAYQAENASLALAAIQLLKGQGFKISNEKTYTSLGKAKVPGRFEIVSPLLKLQRAGQKKPLIILDGAHNPVKVKTFLGSLTQLLPNKKFIFLVAFKKDKDIEQMLKIMTPHSEAFVITEFSKITDMGRYFTTPVKEIENILMKLKFSGDIIIEKDSVKALEKARKLQNKNLPLIITGSLYLVGEIRDKFFPT
ncbi:bifunctional folylpolyglutamate synthase/dihydrofolate synthase [Patescibacteria group bacterium]|nr:bifunctional folylpolyglutamate synthase/dihydrofolate synthase [Patescibacteria group bacterium]